MDVSWSSLKEIFFAIGSLAGVLAFLRPVFDSKFKRDQERAEKIKNLLPEQDVIDLDSHIYQRRLVNKNEFEPFSALQSDLNYNVDAVRFSGPLKKYYKAELVRMLAAYRDLREYVQVPWWKPTKEIRDGAEEYFWDFDKSQLFEGGVERQDYAKHLDEAGACAERIKIAFQRFQIVSDMHLLEAPLASLLLRRRFAAHGLQI
jgi:hypothetical protein